MGAGQPFWLALELTAHLAYSPAPVTIHPLIRSALCGALCLLDSGAVAEELRSDAEQAQWNRALAAMNLTPADTGFSKDVGEPRLVLGWIRSALQDPDAMLRAGDLLWSAAQDTSPSALWVAASALLEVGETPQANMSAPTERDNWEGLPPELAQSLAVGMLKGSAEMLARQPDPALLRERVTSPGGTTAAALQVFERRDFMGMVSEALDAAARRSAELGRDA